MSVYFVRSEEVAEVWPLIKDILTEACNRVACGFTPEDYRKKIGVDRQLWVYLEGDQRAVAVTYVAELPRMKVGVMEAGGGTKIENVAVFLPHLQKFFKENGCKQMELLGSPGWARVMKKYGFKQKYIATVRDI